MSQEKFESKHADLVADKTLVSDAARPGKDTSAGTDGRAAVDFAGDQLVGTILDGKIQIDSLIGQGGMSVVYLGRHLVLNRRVAIKVILPGLGYNEKAVQRLQQEAKAAYSLDHENLASVRDVAITANGLPYLVMDFAAGETLADMLKGGPLTPPKAVEIFKQVCAGLMAAHAKGVIHRDLKPSNIMVEHLPGDSEMVKIVDFGIAKKVTEDADEIHKLTQTGEIFGTPLYMSPEQCHGEKLDQRSDIYSLGCVMYEALTGAPPFKGQSPIATIMLHLEKEAPTITESLGIPLALVGLLHKCLEKNPDDRYQAIKDVYEELVAIEDGRGTRKPKPKTKKRPPGRFSLATLLAVSLGTAAFIFCMFWLYKESYIQLNKREYGYDTVESCDEILKLDAKDIKAYIARGALHFKMNDLPGALADYTYATTLDKNCADGYLGKASVEYKSHKFERAIGDANIYSKLRPGSVEGLRISAPAWFSLHNYAESLKDSNAWLEKNPNDYNGLICRGSCLEEMQCLDQALTDYTRAMNFNNDPYDAYYRRAHVYLYMRSFDKALEDANKSLKLRPTARGYEVRASSYCNLDLLDKGLADAEKALYREPNRPVALIVKAQIFNKMGRYEESSQVCNQLVAHNYRSPTLSNLMAELKARAAKSNTIETQSPASNRP